MKSEAHSRNNDATVSLRKDGRISMTASPLSSGHAPATLSRITGAPPDMIPTSVDYYGIEDVLTDDKRAA
jgi:hypothetical protein